MSDFTKFSLHTVCGMILITSTASLLTSSCATNTTTSQSPQTMDDEMATQAANNLAQPLPIDPKVTTGVLANGLRYYIEPNSKPKQRAELRLVVKAGSVLEDEDQLGLAHVLEHMAFNGTKHFPGNELIHYLESIGVKFGAHLNAYTSFDRTVYMLQVPTDKKELLSKGFQVLADWANGITFSPEEIDKERGVVLEEWRRTRGAGGRVSDQMLPLTYHGSRYAKRRPIGTEKSLKEFSHAALKRFYKDWYRPDLMAVVAVGDFDQEWIKNEIETKFSQLFTDFTNDPKAIRPLPKFPLPLHQETLVKVMRDPEITQSHLTLMTKHREIEGITHADYRNRFLKSQLITLVFNERLKKIFTQPISPILMAYAGDQRLTVSDGMTMIGAGIEEHNLIAAVTTLTDAVERLHRFGVTKEELQRSKTSLLQNMQRYYNQRDTAISRDGAAEIIRHFTIGEAMPGTAYEYKLAKQYVPAISLDEVNIDAKEWMANKGRVMQVSLPQKDSLSAGQARAEQNMALEKRISALWDNAINRSISAPVKEKALGALMADADLPHQGKVVSTHIHQTVGVTEWVLQNGIHIYLKPTPFTADSVGLSAFSKGGDSLVVDADWESATSAISIAHKSGLGGFTPSELSIVLSGKRASISPWIDEFEEGFLGHCSTADIETMLQLLYLNATAPTVAQDGLDLFLKTQTERLQNRKKNPMSAFKDTYTEAMWQGHRRHQAWDVERLKKVNLSAAQRVLNERFRDGNDFTFILVGDFDLPTIKPLIERYIGGLPTLPTTEKAGDSGARRLQGQYTSTVRKGLAPKAYVQWTMHGDIDNSREERYLLRSMATVFSVLLREELREEMSGTYSVAAPASISRYPDEGYQVSVHFGCDPARMDELLEKAEEIIVQITTKPIAQKYIDQTKAQQIRSYESALETNAFWIQAIAGHLKRDLPLDRILGYPDLIKTLNVSQLQRAAKQYLSQDNRVRVVLQPASSAVTPTH